MSYRPSRTDETGCACSLCMGGGERAPAPAEAVSEFCAPSDRQRGLASAFTFFKRWSLRYRIDSNERYLAECERAGITEGRNLDEYRRQMREMRLQLRALEGRQW